MTERLRIDSGEAVADVLPQIGGSLAGVDLRRGAERLPVLRSWSGESESPRTVSLIPTVPWFGRISGGGIRWNGTFHPIQRNDPEDPYPLHGDGWRSAWTVTEHKADRVSLSLRSRAIPPFDYQADLVYSIAGATLDVRLSVEHFGPEPVPYGMGLHPWFPRTPDVTLKATADGTWLEQPPELPRQIEPEPLPAAWDFSDPRRLPTGFIDNPFSGWDGHARIAWPGQGYAVTVEADPAIRLYHVYSLGAHCPIFCFEQVTHLIDAFNLPGAPATKGLRVLASGERTEMRVRYKAELLPSR